ATHVALGVGCTEFTGDRRETQDQGRLGTGLQHLGLRVLRDIATDRQRALRTPTLGMHRTFRNALAVLVRELLDQLIVLHQQRAARTRGERILVVGDRIAGAGGLLIAGWTGVVSRVA